MLHHLRTFARDESGATMIEYGLIAALVAVAAIVALESLGTSIKGIFTSVGTKIDGVKPN
jgi:pilus assembly protein Flp/PilA